MLIAFLLVQSALTLPPTGPDEIEFLIQGFTGHAPTSRRCVRTAGEVRAKVAEIAAEVMTDGQPLIPSAHVKLWLAGVTFSKPAPGEYGKTSLAVEWKTGTLITVTAVNWKWMPSNGLPGVDGAHAPCGGLPPSNAGQ